MATLTQEAYRKFKHMRNKHNVLIPILLVTVVLLVLVFMLDIVDVGLDRNFGSSAIIFTSFASSTFIMFMMPYTKSASPKRFVKSYAIATVFGYLGLLLISYFGIYLATVVVVFLTALFLFETDSEHPPAMGLLFAFVLYHVGILSAFVIVSGVLIIAVLHIAMTKMGMVYPKRAWL
ncbi:MAG: HPP family protein [Candidatus Micrarchaeota archaeon]|nr:HPP family protein [Candidatus Micrarchaeota archaeon]